MWGANDLAAVDKAIKSAFEKKAAEFPEWKAGPALAGNSTANPNGVPGIPDIDARIARNNQQHAVTTG